MEWFDLDKCKRMLKTIYGKKRRIKKEVREIRMEENNLKKCSSSE